MNTTIKYMFKENIINLLNWTSKWKKLKSLNKQFDRSVDVGYSSYTTIDESKILIPNFFRDFKSAKKFLTQKDKWESNGLDGTAKPGMESVFPKWVGKVLLDKFMKEHNIDDDQNSYNIICNYFYNESNKYQHLSSDGILPHIDGLISEDGYCGYICLVNLNDFPVSTVFWNYKNKSYCENKQEEEEFTNFMRQKSKQYYNLSIPDRKQFLNEIEELSIAGSVRYNPNEAIIYPVNLYHSPKIQLDHTLSNPRILLRTVFDVKIK